MTCPGNSAHPAGEMTCSEEWLVSMGTHVLPGEASVSGDTALRRMGESAAPHRALMLSWGTCTWFALGARKMGARCDEA